MYEPLDQPDIQHLCLVCEQTHQQLYPVAKCPHQFCQHCSLAYIAAQASDFAAAHCLQEGCPAPLDKSLPIYAFLDPETQAKLQKFESYQFLQKNPQYSSCKVIDCRGIFLIYDGRCSECATMHCKKCYEVEHQGKCSQQSQEKELTTLSFRKCPSCRIWVEKANGCRFIHCKCGAQFCYTCGSPFLIDPCRKKQIWHEEAQIKQLLANLDIIGIKGFKDALLAIPRVILCLMLILPVTCLFLVVIALTFGAGVVVALFGPLGLWHHISQIECPCKRFVSQVLLVVFYPVMSVILIGGWTVMVLLYPCARKANHHGFYDPFDKALSMLSIYYLRLAGCLLNGFSD